MIKSTRTGGFFVAAWGETAELARKPRLRMNAGRVRPKDFLHGYGPFFMGVIIWERRGESNLFSVWTLCQNVSAGGACGSTPAATICLIKDQKGRRSETELVANQ